MSKKCAPLWREARCEVKMYKTQHLWKFDIWRGSGKRCISHGRCSSKDMFIRDVRRSGCWFSARGCVLEHQIFKFAKMILRDRCSTSYVTWHYCFMAVAALYTDGVEKRKTHWYEAVSFALNFPILKEVSVNCFLFDVVNFRKFRKSRRLASFLKSSVQKIRMSRRIASFSNLQKDRQTDR